MSSRMRLLAKIVIIAVLVGGFSFFGLFKAWDYLVGPKISIESPKDGETVSSSYIEIRGKAKNVSLLSLDGRQIFAGQDGLFKESLLLAKGYNIIELSAKDKFNREIKIRREVVLK
ncbi:MAG: hypothetical protein WC587_03510 [Candidatus Paceibacterota bacterium]